MGHIKKMSTTSKKGIHLQKYLKLNNPPLENWLKPRKITQTFKNESHFEIWVKTGKVGHTWETWSYFT